MKKILIDNDGVVTFEGELTDQEKLLVGERLGFQLEDDNAGQYVFYTNILKDGADESSSD